MAFESFAAVAVFEVINRSAASLSNIERQVLAIEAAATRAQTALTAMSAVRFGPVTQSVRTLPAAVANVQKASDEMGAAFVKNLAAADEALLNTIGLTDRLAARLEEVAISSRAFATVGAAAAAAAVAAGGGGRRGGSGGGGNDLHLRGYVPLGPLHARVSVGAAGGAIAAMGFGAYEEAQLEHTIARMMLVAEQPMGPGMMGTPIAQQIRKSILEAMAVTGLSARQVEAASMPAILQMGGVPFQDRVKMLPDLFRFAAIESIMKGVDPADATQSLVGILHMTGAYQPDQMRKLAAQFAFASTISPVGLPGIERAASYVVPFATNTLGLDPGVLLLVLAQAQSAGILQGKGGTWFQALFQSLSPKGNFASLLTGRGSQQRITALRQLGMVGPGGDPTGLKLLEKNDWADFIDTLRTNLQKVPEEYRGGLLYQAFGSHQAARAAATLLIPAFTQLLPELRKEQQAFLSASGGPEATLNEMAQADPVLQTRQALQRLVTVLIDLGSTVLPPLVTGFSGLSEALKGINNVLGAGLFGKLILMSAGAAIGARVGGVPGAAVGGASGFLLGEIGEDTPEARSKRLAEQERRRQEGLSFFTTPFHWLFGPSTDLPAPGTLTAGAAPLVGGALAAAHRPITITGNTIIVHSVTDDPESHADAILGAINRKIADSQTTNIGPGSGTLSSPFTNGGGP